MILGIHLSLLIGPTVPVPAPPLLTEVLSSVEVTHSDEGPSGFQMTFEVGRSGPSDVVDYQLLLNPLLRPFNRVILTIIFNAVPHVLMDGFITNHQFAPTNEAGGSTFTVTGEDVSVMMDMQEKTDEHVAMPEPARVARILLQYQQYLLSPPIIIPPPTLLPPIPTAETPVQNGTDRQYIQELAELFGFVFYVKPGLVPGQNIAYWGPPERLGFPQPALSFGMGVETNVASISFQRNALAPTLVSGRVLDEDTNQNLPVETFFSVRPPLALMPDLLVNAPNIRRTLLGDTSDQSVVKAFANAQAMTDESTDEVVTAEGELDAMRYGHVLQPRDLVGLRGVGFTYDGLYYVKKVTHTIKKGEYKQGFTLTREGTGSITPIINP